MRTIFHLKLNKSKSASALRIAVLSLGACVLLLSSSGSFAASPGSPAALEASVFNGGKCYESSEAAPQVAPDAPTEVVPLGSAFGVKLFTNGVIVASLSDIYTENGVCCPAADAGVKPGDYLLKADGVTIDSNDALARLIGGGEGRPVVFTVRRGDKTFEATVTPAYGEGSFKTGMWIRDSAAGIGTLTFYDPASGSFAGLGHGICDMDTAGVMALKTGEPAPITLCGVIRGEAEHPGQLKGYFSSDEAMGRLLVNNETGVYGALSQAPGGKTVKVTPREEVRPGPVKILATVDENGPRLYDGEILRVSAVSQRTKNLVVKVTDQRLLALTGGIVQGMSGCPILQDGKLCGAVTHVFTDDPTTGYGIFAQTMCEESAICSVSK